jgi:hypothetical protein
MDLLAVPLAFEISDIKPNNLAFGIAVAAHEIVINQKSFQNVFVEALVADKFPVANNGWKLLKRIARQLSLRSVKRVICGRGGEEQNNDD